MGISRFVPRRLWVYPVLYLVLVLGFGITFFLMPGHFYHTTIQFEPTVRELESKLCISLGREFTRNAQFGATDVQNSNQWKIDAWVYDLELAPPAPGGERDLIAKTIFHCLYKPGFARFNQHCNVLISSMGSIGSPPFQPIRDSTGKIEVVDKKSYQVRPVNIEETRRVADAMVYGNHLETPDVRDAFLCQEIPGIDDHCLELNGTTDDSLQVYIDIVKGLPRSTEGLFPRMLYLSAVTITTLGLGDILPLTALARTLVTIESLLGPFLFGMFLAALSDRGLQNYRMSDSENPETGTVSSARDNVQHQKAQKIKRAGKK